MFAAASLEPELGSGAFLLDAGLVSILLLVSGAGFALSRSAFRSTSSSASEAPRRHRPRRKAARAECGKVPSTPTMGADATSDEQVPTTPTTEAGSTCDEKASTTTSIEVESTSGEKGAALPKPPPERAAFVEALGPAEAHLLAQVRALAREAFDDDAVPSQRGEKVAVLAVGDEVLGYATYNLRPQLGSLNINKLAVSRARRRQGHGRCILRHLIQLGKRAPSKPGRGGCKAQPPLEVVCLSALPTAITFYKACGFKEDPGVKLPEEEDEELEEGQVYMEYRLRKRRVK